MLHEVKFKECFVFPKFFSYILCLKFFIDSQTIVTKRFV